MKKQLLLLVAIVCLSVSASFAQKLAFGGHVGFSKLTSKEIGRGGGLNYLLEGRYFLTPQLSVGAEYASSAFLTFIIDAAGEELTDAELFGNKQFNLKANYNFLDKKVTPYVSVGLGYSGIKTPEYSVNGQVVSESVSKAGFGISPRLGLKLGGFNIEYQYNLGAKTPVVAGSSFSDKKFNFWTINLGYVYTLDMNDK
jgi:opacity protein-like surface antigen